MQGRARRDGAAARREAERASAVLERSPANISHELRTPPKGVLGVAALLDKTRLSARQAGLVGVIRSSAGALHGVSCNILNQMQDVTGQVDIAPVPFDLNAVVLECAQAFEPEAARRGIDLAVRIEVEDTGCGIAEADRHTIFDAFDQGDHRDGTRPGGSGRGLTIAHLLVQAMGGQLTCLPNPTGGSVFVISLALPFETPRPMAAAEQPLSGRNLVVITPRARTRLALAERLAAEGAAVRVFATQPRLRDVRGSRRGTTLTLIDRAIAPQTLARWRLVRDFSSPARNYGIFPTLLIARDGGQEADPPNATTLPEISALLPKPVSGAEIPAALESQSAHFAPHHNRVDRGVAQVC